VLSSPAVSAKYAKNYIGAHADFGELQKAVPGDPRHAMVERLNPRKYRPVLVFLDVQGKEVMRFTGGLRSEKDALLLDRYVSGRHYLMMDFDTFRAANS
jgi:hypothetical protein